MANNYEIGESSGSKGSDDDFDIPPGFRFRPSHEDMMYYLRSKLSNPSQFYSHMPDVDIYAYSPTELAVKHNFDAESEGYFFTPRSKKYPNGCRPDRSTQNGYWKPSSGKDVVAEGRFIGYVRTLKYLDTSNRPTEWLMKEYAIGKDSKTFYAWVAVKIYRKRGANNNNTFGEFGGQISAAEELAEQDFAASQPIVNHPAQMDSFPHQQFQSRTQSAPQFMGQAQMTPLPYQQFQNQAQCDLQYLGQAPQPIQAVEPTVGQMSLDPNSGPLHFNFDAQAMIPQLETLEPEEPQSVAPQRPDGQLSTDMNCLNTNDQQIDLDWSDYDFDFLDDPRSLNQDLPFLDLEAECENFDFNIALWGCSK